jgi:hypothetical protein
VLTSLGVFSLAGSFRCLFLLLFLGALYVAWVFFYVGLFSVRAFFFFKLPFPSFWFVGALYVAWVSFTWVYFLLEPPFFF